jgi:hypothetical protein
VIIASPLLLKIYTNAFTRKHSNTPEDIQSSVNERPQKFLNARVKMAAIERASDNATKRTTVAQCNQLHGYNFVAGPHCGIVLERMRS